MKPFSFDITHRFSDTLARTGVIHTPHGDIETPAFIVVGTKANVKAMVPEMVKSVGAQAVLANAYHLYLQPGHELIEKAGYLGKFMNWNGRPLPIVVAFRCCRSVAVSRKFWR